MSWTHFLSCLTCLDLSRLGKIMSRPIRWKTHGLSRTRFLKFRQINLHNQQILSEDQNGCHFCLRSLLNNAPSLEKFLFWIKIKTKLLVWKELYGKNILAKLEVKWVNFNIWNHYQHCQFDIHHEFLVNLRKSDNLCSYHWWDFDVKYLKTKNNYNNWNLLKISYFLKGKSELITLSMKNVNDPLRNFVRQSRSWSRNRKSSPIKVFDTTFCWFFHGEFDEINDFSKFPSIIDCWNWIISWKCRKIWRKKMRKRLRFWNGESLEKPLKIIINRSKPTNNYHFCPKYGPFIPENSVLSRFPGQDKTRNAVLSRLVSRFSKIWMSRLVLKSNFRALKNLDLSWYASLLSCFFLNPYFCLSVLSCLVSKHFQDFVSVSSCLVSRISCPDPSLSWFLIEIHLQIQVWKIQFIHKPSQWRVFTITK